MSFIPKGTMNRIWSQIYQVIFLAKQVFGHIGRFKMKTILA